MSESDEIKAKLSEKETHELLRIWCENRRDEWRDEAFDAIQEILGERNVTIPEQPQFVPPELPTRWLKFYTYVGIPLGILYWISQLFSILQQPEQVLALVVSAIDIGLLVFLFVGLHRRRLWGWRLNWFVLVLEVLIRPANAAFTPSELPPNVRLMSYLISVVIISLIWLLPNAIYFRKRRHLFA